MAWTWSSCGKHSHRVFMQERDYSCVIACMLMALDRKKKLNTAGATFRRLAKKKIVSTAITAKEMRQASQQFGGPGYYRPSAIEVGAQVGSRQQDALASILTQQIGSSGYGTYFKNATHTLKRLGFSADYFPNASWQQILSFVGWSSYAVIGSVNWRGGGLHAVYLDGIAYKTKTTWKGLTFKRTKIPAALCVCDPGHGARRVVLHENGAKPTYRPATGSAAQFTSEVIVI